VTELHKIKANPPRSRYYKFEFKIAKCARVCGVFSSRDCLNQFLLCHFHQLKFLNMAWYEVLKASDFFFIWWPMQMLVSLMTIQCF
jgi:hypothetical protein